MSTEQGGTGSVNPTANAGSGNPSEGVGIADPVVNVGSSGPSAGVGSTNPSAGAGSTDPTASMGGAVPTATVGGGFPSASVGGGYSSASVGGGGQTAIMGGANPTANTTSVLRIMNERAVYDRIRVLGPVSRPQLAAATGLSKPTISLALADLERAGLVVSVGHRTGNAGRAALLYEIRPEAGWVIGLDVGREWIRAALVDLTGEITVRKDVPAGADSATTLIARLGRLVDDLAAEADGTITNIVLGTPGVHDADNGRLRLAPNLPGWERPGVIGRLAERLEPISFAIENDIALAALGEQGYGLGAGLRHFVYVSIGTGIGMGIIVDGKLYRGARGAAGEIAFLPMGESDPLANAPGTRRHGMLESVASGPGVVATAHRLGMPGPITAKRVFDQARAGDPIAVRAVAHEADHVARALAGIVALLDPELVVLGGGIGGHGADVLLGAVRERLETMTPLGPPRIEVSPLGDEAVVLGALATGLATARALVFDRAIAGAQPV